MNRLPAIVNNFRVCSDVLSKTIFAGTPCVPLVLVRTATKKVAGSTTNNRNSAGRRLGPKKGEGELVNVGDILYRQRGTRFYPGENVTIGKDHTLVANEVGYVRFYRDPFHPKRKFIGLAIDKDARLPTPHFAPRPRRLGYVPVTNKYDKDIILDWMPRKDSLALPIVLEKMEQREKKRQEKKQKFKSQLQQLTSELTEQELELASDRVVSIHTYLVNGRSFDEAKQLTDDGFLRDNRLAIDLKKGDVSHLTELESLYKALIPKLDSLVMFDPDYNLSAYTSAEELRVLKKQTLAHIRQLMSSDARYTEEVKAEIKEQLKKPCFSLHERDLFTKAFIRNEPPRAESKDFSIDDMKKLQSEGKGKIIQNWNYDKKCVERVFLPKGTRIEAIH